VEGDLTERAIALARGLADGTMKRPPIATGSLAHVPGGLPAIDIGHRSRRIDAILCRTILEGAKLALKDGLALEARSFGEVCETRDMRIGVETFLKEGPRAKAPFVHA
jgi:hypothetical protein